MAWKVTAITSSGCAKARVGGEDPDGQCDSFLARFPQGQEKTLWKGFPMGVPPTDSGENLGLVVSPESFSQGKL